MALCSTAPCPLWPCAAALQPPAALRRCACSARAAGVRSLALARVRATSAARRGLRAGGKATSAERPGAGRWQLGAQGGGRRGHGKLGQTATRRRHGVIGRREGHESDAGLQVWKMDFGPCVPMWAGSGGWEMGCSEFLAKREIATIVARLVVSFLFFLNYVHRVYYI